MIQFLQAFCFSFDMTARRSGIIVVFITLAALVPILYVVLKTQRLEAEAERFLREEQRIIALRHSQPGAFVGSLLIPRLNTQTAIIEGTGKQELDRAPGHLTGSPLPGQPGNAVIAGHRDSHFRNLRQLRRGDLLMLETGGDVHVYRVVDQTIVVPTDTSVLDPTTRPTLTLITCYPFFFVGHAPKRYILRAELV